MDKAQLDRVCGNRRRYGLMVALKGRHSWLEAFRAASLRLAFRAAQQESGPIHAGVYRCDGDPPVERLWKLCRFKSGGGGLVQTPPPG